MFRTYLNIILFAVGMLSVVVPFADAGCISSSRNYYDTLACMDGDPLYDMYSGRGLENEYWKIAKCGSSTGWWYYAGSPHNYANAGSVNVIPCPAPFVPNYIKDGDEDGIDCGGSSGNDCMATCESGYVMYDGVCTAIISASVVYADGTKLCPNGSYVFNSSDPCVDMSNIVSPVLSAYPNQSDWVPPPTSDLNTEVVSFSKLSDVVVYDSLGNVISQSIESDPVVVDNGDGTSTSTVERVEFDDTGQQKITSTVTTLDSAGDIVDSSSTTSITNNQSNISNSTSIASGSGSSSGLTGDQFSSGVKAIADSVDKSIDEALTDEQVTSANFVYSSTDYGVFDGQLLEGDLPEELSIIDTIQEFAEKSPLFILLNGIQIQTVDAQCHFDIEGLVFFGQSMQLALDMCRWESNLVSMGSFLLMFCQALAVIVIFRGFK